jgi:acyl transferase domain-containing protein/acyl carrier protein
MRRRSDKKFMSPKSPDTSVPDSAIAVIGMTCRFPGAKNVSQFWQNLRAGVESISFFTDEELDHSSMDLDAISDPHYVRARGILDGIESFDALFFGFNPREAEIMDPQHRLYLECAWEALEDAGYDSKSYQGKIGVYSGVGTNTYLLFNLSSNSDSTNALNGLRKVGNIQIRIGNEKDFVSTRVSYKLDLRGPSLIVQTACSTSLVAVHLACQSLRASECSIALAGSVSITVPQKRGYLYQEGGIASPDGHCRAFDAKAQGTVGGNGVGIVVLKRLGDALADGDCIHAVIKGTAINNDGSFKAGFTAPSIRGQASVIKEALANARINAETVSYIETHGTGTTLGDPLEIAALNEVFQARTQEKQFCALGSVKTNVGHLDRAAGMAGLIKTILALRHKMIPPSLHFKEPNPEIDFANSPFYVNTKLSDWSEGQTPRRAGVSSFGIGGTNAHLVLEEAPSVQESRDTQSYKLLVLSAMTTTALDKMTTNLVKHLQKNPEISLSDTAYTLQTGRRAFSHRRTLVCRDVNDAVTELALAQSRQVSTTSHKDTSRSVVFMFPGQGSQYTNIGLNLYQDEPSFRAQVDRCVERLVPILGFDLRDVLYPTGKRHEKASEQLAEASIAQPALFVVSYALARMLMKWGVRPQALIGHSLGEYVAACLAGVFSLDEALTLVAERGRLMQQIPRGSMLAVSLRDQKVEALLGNRLSIAAINSPSQCVVAGPVNDVDKLHELLTRQGVNCKYLRVAHAFHSEMVEPILDLFAREIGKVSLKSPQIPYISNVTGTWIKASEATDPNYWLNHLRQTVRFGKGIEEVLRIPDAILLEVGPGRNLSTLVNQQPDKNRKRVVLNTLRHPAEDLSDTKLLLSTLGKLWREGVEIDWVAFNGSASHRRISLPTYPFERQRYWIEPVKKSQAVPTPEAALDKNPDVGNWFYVPYWKPSVPPAPWVSGNLSQQKWSWLIFVEDCGLGERIVERLEQAGHDVVTVKAGERFRIIGDRHYEINPRRPDDYAALIGALIELGQVPQKVIHLWSVTAHSHTESEQDLGFYSLMFLARALGEHELIARLQLQVVANNMQAVSGHEVISPEKATLLGPCKVIPQEYPRISCRNLDIIVPEPGIGWKDEQIEQLMGEFVSGFVDFSIALRGNQRWVQAFEAIRLEAQSSPPARLRMGGVYLITGGLGGVGLELAEYLARTLQAKLILVGRSTFPHRHDWNHWLETHDNQDEIGCEIRRIQALEKLGAEVLALSADVSSVEQMQSVMAESHRRFGRINGLIHAAGVADGGLNGGLIHLRTPESAASILRSKVKGTLVLDLLFKDEELDFLVLCSSLGSIVGGIGQATYCAANAFLDAFAHRTSNLGKLIVSINWEAWTSVGMSVKGTVPAQFEERRDERLRKGLSSNEGVDAFVRIMHNNFTQVIISTRNLQSVIEQSSSPTVSSGPPGSEKESLPKLSHRRPEMNCDYFAPGNEAEQQIACIWQECLGLEQVGVYDDFFQLGGDSLLATQIIFRLRDTFHAGLTLRDFFNHPTIADLAATIKKTEEFSTHIKLLRSNRISRISRQLK